MAEDLDILSTPDPEGNRLLERVVEVVRLPVLDVVGELGELDRDSKFLVNRCCLP
jgi:hypothetical protein